MSEKYIEPMVVDKNGNIYYSAKVINELDDEKDKEIERLNNIIKEVKEYIEKYSIMYEHEVEPYKVVESEELLEILDKGE